MFKPKHFYIINNVSEPVITFITFTSQLRLKYDDPTVVNDLTLYEWKILFFTLFIFRLNRLWRI